MLSCFTRVALNGAKSHVDDAAVEYLLPETHVRAGGWRFQYPTDWTVDEQNAYTLLVIPGTETTIGISALRDPDAARLDSWAEAVLDNLLRNFPTGEHEFHELTLDDHPARRLDFRVPQQESGFTQWFLYAGEDVLVNLTIIGAPLDIDMLSPLIEALVVTVQPVD